MLVLIQLVATAELASFSSGCLADLAVRGTVSFWESRRKAGDSDVVSEQIEFRGAVERRCLWRELSNSMLFSAQEILSAYSLRSE